MTERIALRQRVLADRRITNDEVEAIQRFIVADRSLDFEDVKFLVELATGVDEVCPEFEDVLFPCLRSVILEDGIVSPEEQVLLMELFADRELRLRELQFLAGLYEDVQTVTPALKKVFESVLGTVPS